MIDSAAWQADEVARRRDDARATLKDVSDADLVELAGLLADQEAEFSVVPEHLVEQARALLTLGRLNDTSPAAAAGTMLLLQRVRGIA
jgi:hypothetical protein